jgi:hypothetical protein
MYTTGSNTTAKTTLICKVWYASSKKTLAFHIFSCVIMKHFLSFCTEILNVKHMTRIWNEQRSVLLITFMIYLCLYVIIIESVKFWKLKRYL